MGLGSSLYAGITGLTVHSERMTVIGNNLANVNTVGFKGTWMQFEDLLSQDFATVNGVGQIGRGVRVSTIYSDFGQGSFESSTEATDVAISGDGMFVLSPKGLDSKFYSRAGNFRFDNDGYLVDPHGYVVQGWAVEQATTSVSSTSATTTSTVNSTRIVGTPTDIRLDNFQSSPKATSSMSVVTNLDPTATDKSTSATHPYFAMFENWDGTEDTPLDATRYSYSTTMKVFDDIGTAHNVTVYFDPVTLSNAGGDTVWEYMVTVNPSEDRRMLSGADGNITSIGKGLTEASGVLMVGTLTFTTGQLTAMSAFTLKSNGGMTGGPDDLRNWTPADFSTGGYPVFTANFLGKSNASTAEAANATPIQMDFGISNNDLSGNGWTVSLGTMPSNAAAAQLAITNSTGYLPSFRDPAVSALATQSYNTGGSSTLFQGQDGYSAGILQNISVSREGVLTGHYSNGEVIELYALTLATFTNKHGLRREGGNLFSETRESGPALTGQAGSSGKGTVDGNALELSNVDMATEFVRMITTQRGFQANTKVITTTDSMLGEVIAMKR
ncbi:MAG: flagellar hook protein FlgE [Pseudodesulfovibrio sp.]|uniref:Flagellar hook protein FlgE n=1 Tax=Pseudodesulfovibrio aespoeensis (strain ATCC 700646 / DSM 10631 / Aspo-2) TaxID=643562 RepID=E6VZV5_PSEA9|nr:MULTISPECIES: flagellar hook protein FlgE [Pseudodesulfovibrio]MBU4190846.1 flagellar hook protein FlgE [Pseudomonadota bacterium]ADU64037.1 flagellar hook-basal body protein [Pseudodesulfovibrio aespoeensis Aspo-2]MBU4244573.1 flagellar hook protein FlgE [Pseudomonadota bacterium]MBU4378205.1 flagellar hook protein FlgE [Pseudomonadota bacterium]MBU4475351.1 flagellar hook protein FlgE [Pseudomonadota bacterium]